MKHLSSLVLGVFSGYVQLAISADATLYGCYDNQGSLEVKQTDDFQSKGACRITCVDNSDPGYAVQAMTNSTLCLCSQTLPNEVYKVADDLCRQTCPGFEDDLCGSQLGQYFSVYLTGLDPSPGEDPAPMSSSSSSASSTRGCA